MSREIIFYAEKNRNPETRIELYWTGADSAQLLFEALTDLSYENNANYVKVDKAEKEIKRIVSNSSINNLIRPNIKIITVSNHSKFSILSFYPQIKEENIKICYSPSFNQLENNSIKSIEFSKIKEKINIEAKKYFLLTNSEPWIKNAIRAIQAFDLILDDKKFCDYKLVLTGIINKKIFKK